MRVWQELERHYVDELGDSRHAAHQKIAKQYNAGWSTVAQYLMYGHPGKHRSNRSYSDQKTNPNYLPKHTFLKRFRREPAQYLAPVFSAPDEAISLEDLSLRLHSAYGWLPHLPTLQKVAEHGHTKTGQPILEKVGSGSSPLYKLAQDLYRKHKSR